MQRFTRSAVAFVALSAVVASGALAGDYKIQALNEKGAFTGCVMADEALGLGVVSVDTPATTVLLAHANVFAIAPGDDVTGSWSVDGGKATDFSSKSTNANIANIPLANADAMAPILSGKQLQVTAKGKKTQYDLTDFPKGEKSLEDCMKTKKTP